MAKIRTSKFTLPLCALLFPLCAAVFIGYEWQEVRSPKSALTRTIKIYRQFLTEHAPPFWDEPLYLMQNPDVAEAIRNNEYTEGAFHHLLYHGIPEGRPYLFISPATPINQQTQQVFLEYIEELSASADTELERLKILLDWFSANTVRSSAVSEKDLVNRLRAPFRYLPLHESFYLLHTNQHPVLCGNSAYLFARLLRKLGYEASDYDTGIPGTRHTHVFCLVRYALPDTGETRLSVWDPFFNYYIADLNGEPADLRAIFYALHEFYQNGTAIPFQVIHGNARMLKFFLSEERDQSKIVEEYIVSDERIPDGYVLTNTPVSDNFLETGLQEFRDDALGDLFVAKILALPLSDRDKQQTQKYLHQFPELPNLVRQSLDIDR